MTASPDSCRPRTLCPRRPNRSRRRRRGWLRGAGKPGAEAAMDSTAAPSARAVRSNGWKTRRRFSTCSTCHSRATPSQQKSLRRKRKSQKRSRSFACAEQVTLERSSRRSEALFVLVARKSEPPYVGCYLPRRAAGHG